MSLYGGPVPTPNWERLAARGAVFDRSYCATPLCIPTRPSMQTSLMPHAHGSTSFGQGFCTIHRGSELLLNRLHHADYKTGYTGIWHLNMDPADDVTDQFTYFEKGGFPYNQHIELLEKAGFAKGSQYHLVRTPTDAGNLHEWEFSVPIPVTLQGDAVTHPDMIRAQAIADFIRTNRTDSYAAWCSFATPHPPLLVPEEYVGMFSPDDITLPYGLGQVPDNEPAAVANAPGRQSITDWSERQWAQAIAYYYAYVAFGDACLGVLLDALDDTGDAERTVVVATGDHGEMLGHHNLYQKGVPYQRAVRVPLVYAADGLEPGRRDQLVSHIDFAPTILELLGEQPLADAHGASQCAVLQNPHAPGRDTIMIEFNGYIMGGFKWRSLVDAQHMYCHYNDGTEELYDLLSDPDETNNCISNKDYTDTVQHMRQQLYQWMQQTGDDTYLSIFGAHA